MAGNAAGAQQAFEAAAGMVHAADAELGLVRAYMQAGAYRQALSFAAHAAGAHREVPGGMALYAWLLTIGGQQTVALRILDEWIDRLPDDATLIEARAQLATSAPRAGARLLASPWRTAPQDGALPIPFGTTVRATGVLSNDARQAWVPASALEGAQRVWVRNGLGQCVSATVAQIDVELEVALLELGEGLPAPHRLAWSPAAPSAGGPSYLVEFVESDNAQPAWPLLRQGFFARYPDPLKPRRLGIEVPPGRHGGPVLDRLGQFAGIAIQASDGSAQLLPSALIAQRWPRLAAGEPPSAPDTPVAPVAMFEAALTRVLQVLVLR